MPNDLAISDDYLAVNSCDANGTRVGQPYWTMAGIVRKRLLSDSYDNIDRSRPTSL
jgi:hypothetical protein